MLAIRSALAMVAKAKVVPGIDGSTYESTMKTRDQPNGRPSTSESNGPDGTRRIGKELPQWVPEPGLENLIIQ
jgi:hypothetical protein